MEDTALEEAHIPLCRRRHVIQCSPFWVSIAETPMPFLCLLLLVVQCMTSAGDTGGACGGTACWWRFHLLHPRTLITLCVRAFTCSCRLWPIHLNAFPHSESYPVLPPPDGFCLFALFSKELSNSTFPFILFPADLNTHFQLL